VLAGCLALAAILLHLRSRTLASTALFTLAMLAKPSAASALLIAAIIDFLILRRPIRESIQSLGGWLIVAIPLLVIARSAQTTELVEHVSLLKRPLIAVDAIGFYLIKLIAPVSLGTDYGRSPARVLSVGIGVASMISIACMIAVACIRSRTLIASALILIAGLIFNLGLVPFQFQLYSTVADHYIYLAALGPALAVAFVIRQTPERIALPFAGVVCAALIGLTVRQTMFWRDSVTLFSHAVEVNPLSAGSHNNLGRALGERGALDAAARHFEAALAIQSGTPLAHRNLAFVQFRRGQIDAAIDQLKQSIQMMEQNFEDVSSDRRDLVNWLAERGRWPEAVEQLERAQRHDPTNPSILRMLTTARERATTMPAATAPTQ